MITNEETVNGKVATVDFITAILSYNVNVTIAS